MKLNARRGQSLVEVMIALSILVTGMMGILGLLSQSIFISKTVTNETTATYLAEEGIELAGNLVNHDMYGALATPPSGGGWGSCFAGANGDYELDYTMTDCALMRLHNITGSAADYLEYNQNSHTYLYAYDDLPSPGSATIFTRRIRFTPHGANEVTVDSIVEWQASGATQDVTLEDQFYNWHP